MESDLYWWVVMDKDAKMIFSPEIVIQLCVLQLSANVEILVLIAEMSCITSDEDKACSLDLLLD